MTAGLDGGATAAALGVSAGVTYDGALTLLSGKRKGRQLPAHALALLFAAPGLRTCPGTADAAPALCRQASSFMPMLLTCLPSAHCLLDSTIDDFQAVTHAVCMRWWIEVLKLRRVCSRSRPPIQGSANPCLALRRLLCGGTQGEAQGHDARRDLQRRADARGRRPGCWCRRVSDPPAMADCCRCTTSQRARCPVQAAGMQHLP